MASSTSQGFPERFRSPLRGVRSRSMRNERTKSCCPVHCPRGASCSSRVAGCWAAPKVLQRWAAPLWVPAKAPSPRAHLRPWHHLCVCWCRAATPSCCLLPFGPAFGVSETPKRQRFPPFPAQEKGGTGAGSVAGTWMFSPCAHGRLAAPTWVLPCTATDPGKKPPRASHPLHNALPRRRRPR